MAGLQTDVPYDPVALVENAQNRDALRHRGDARLLPGTDARPLCARAVTLLGALFLATAAGDGDGEQRCHGGCRDEPDHAQSGVQG